VFERTVYLTGLVSIAKASAAYSLTERVGDGMMDWASPLMLASSPSPRRCAASLCTRFVVVVVSILYSSVSSSGERGAANLQWTKLS
jgi:hypothetical protein